MLFISTALADGTTGQSGGGWMSFLPLVAFVGILYFLLIRPQQKRQKQHQSLISAIKKGDKVVTNSGIVGTISKVLNDNEVVLEIAEGVHCKFVKSAISNVVNNETPTVTTPASVEIPKKVEKKEKVQLLSQETQSLDIQTPVVVKKTKSSVSPKKPNVKKKTIAKK
ncbi:MAG: preprotein translocase subunit YajC [Holosporales bacterium]|jgi:preprotein translocase subunit YajC|nr:preprotein translocase subunit YajC [Holosporales bacterium]